MKEDTNLYFETSEANNLDSLKADADPSSATPSNVKKDYGFRDTLNNEFMIGEMPIIESENIKINPKYNSSTDNEYTIPKGYHDGHGKVYTGDLEEYTRGDATPEDVAKNKICWVNGVKIVGTLDIEAGEQTGDATADDIVEGKTAWVNKLKILGRIPKLFRRDKTLLAGESYTYPYGLSPGTSIISAASLSSQTVGNATAKDILEGKVAWVNGEKVVGTLSLRDAIKEELSDTDTLKSEVLYGKKFYSDKYQQIVSGSMPNHTGESVRTINIGETFYIPEGYYNGQSSIKTKLLEDATIASARKENILTGKTAWVNGEKITGEMDYNDPEEIILDGGVLYNIPKGYHTGNGKIITQSSRDQTPGTAEPKHIRDGYTAWVNGVKITGSLPTKDIGNLELQPDGEYIIPEGYHPGTEFIWTKGLDELTLGDALPENILKDKVAWVNGERVVGTLEAGNIVQLRILVGHEYQIPPGYYPYGVKVYSLYEPPTLDLEGTDAYWKELKLYPETAGFVDGKQLIITDNPV